MTWLLHACACVCVCVYIWDILLTMRPASLKVIPSEESVIRMKLFLQLKIVVVHYCISCVHCNHITMLSLRCSALCILWFFWRTFVQFWWNVLHDGLRKWSILYANTALFRHYTAGVTRLQWESHFNIMSLQVHNQLSVHPTSGLSWFAHLIGFIH